MAIFDEINRRFEEAADTASKAVEQTKREVGQFVKETKPDVDLNPFDDGKFRLKFGNDKQPIEYGFGFEFEKDKNLGIPLPKIEGIGRLGGWGLAGKGSLRTEDLARILSGKAPIDVELISPQKERLDDAARRPEARERTSILRGIFSSLDDLIKPKGLTTDEEFKKVLDKTKPSIGGFTVPKGVLAADKGVYAAVLNGKQGFLDKATGKWSEYTGLSDEQKSRIASDYINDPAELAKALPTGGYTKQPLYLPEFQKVQAP